MSIAKNTDVYFKRENLMRLIRIYIFIVISSILIIFPVFLP